VELRNNYISNGVFISQLPVCTFTEIVKRFPLIEEVNRSTPHPG